MRILLATGLSKIEEQVKTLLQDIQIERCYHRRAILPAVEEYQCNTVVLSPALDGTEDLLEGIIRPLRENNIRVIFLPGGADMPDAREWVKKLVPWGVYCYVFDPVTAEEVVNRIRNPGSIKTLPKDIKESLQQVETSSVAEVIEETFEKVQNAQVELQKQFQLKEKVSSTVKNILRFNWRRNTETETAGFVSDDTATDEKIDSKEDVQATGGTTGKDETADVQDVQPDYYRDLLTGCYSRRFLIEKLVPDDFYSVVFIDLDGFKPVNDVLGHDAGDKVLAAFGRLLNDSLKGKDFAVRWGGDEFVLVLPKTSRYDAEKVVENIRKEWTVCAPDTGNLKVGFSFGIAEGRDTGDLQKAIKEADRLMYANKSEKKAGRPATDHNLMVQNNTTAEKEQIWPGLVKGITVVVNVLTITASIWAADWILSFFDIKLPYLHEAAETIGWFWKTLITGITGRTW